MFIRASQHKKESLREKDRKKYKERVICYERERVVQAIEF
jgi:ribosomal protein S30